MNFPLLNYFFRKKDPSRPVNFDIKAMHWINRIAIIIFLGGITWRLVLWMMK